MNKENKVHEYDAAWKTILEAFEEEVVELLFPEIYNEINWEIKSESLDNELLEIQKHIFSKADTEKVISDRIIKVRLKDNKSKILFIHVEVQSYSSKEKIFEERMFRYFYRIWDRFRYKYDDKSDIVGAAIYTYAGKVGKGNNYTYKIPGIDEDIIRYNFRTIDVETIDLDIISVENPLKEVFIIAKRLLLTEKDERNIFEAKKELFYTLCNYEKVKNEKQMQALQYFLEYLFLINDKELEKEFKMIMEMSGGKLGMGIDEIREKYLESKGREEGEINGIALAKKVFKLSNQGETIGNIAKLCDLSEEKVREILE